MFYDKDPDEAYNFLEFVSESSQSWDPTSECEGNDSPQPWRQSHGEHLLLKSNDDLDARMEAFMAKKFQSLELESVKAVSIRNVCAICETSEHGTSECPKVPLFRKLVREPEATNPLVSVNFVGNSSWRTQNQQPHQTFQQHNQSQTFQTPPFNDQNNHFGEGDFLEDSVDENHLVAMNATIQQLMELQQMQGLQFQQLFQAHQELQSQNQFVNESLAKLSAQLENGSLSAPCNAVTTLRSGKTFENVEKPWNNMRMWILLVVVGKEEEMSILKRKPS